MSEEINLFKQFVGEMDVLLRDNDAANGPTNRQLMNELFKLENRFKDTLLSTSQGALVYEKFMTFILEDKENKLTVRPYFRERQDTFSNKFFPILREKNSRKLHRFRISYKFVRYAVETYKGPDKRKLKRLHDSIVELRKQICENNLPMAINRARHLWSKIPPTHAEYMDLIQESSKGLLEAIDKFAPPFNGVFMSTAMARMGLNMSDLSNQTLVKMSPKDKRILYRARKAKQKNPEITGDNLKEFVNESFKGVSASDIAAIEAAANQMDSLDYSPDGGRTMGEMMEDPVASIDHAERNELNAKLLMLIDRLKIIERKILVMKYGEIYGVLTKET